MTSDIAWENHYTQLRHGSGVLELTESELLDSEEFGFDKGLGKNYLTSCNTFAALLYNVDSFPMNLSF